MKPGLHIKVLNWIVIFRQNYRKLLVIQAQLNQVFVNLVVNAIQAMPDGGKLILKTDADKEYVSLVIEDTGIGNEQRGNGVKSSIHSLQRKISTKVRDLD